MSDDHETTYAGNSSIDTAIKEMLPSFDEASQRRIRKAILAAGSAAKRHLDKNTDAAARHVFRELIPAAHLNNQGFRLRYEAKVAGKTPDWLDEDTGLLMECYTYERGGSAGFDDRVAAAVAEKCGRYSTIVQERGLRFVVAVYLDFLTAMTIEECAEDPERFRGIFDTNKKLSGLLFFTETLAVGGRQQYEFVCISADSSIPSLPNWPFHTRSLNP